MNIKDVSVLALHHREELVRCADGSIVTNLFGNRGFKVGLSWVYSGLLMMKLLDQYNKFLKIAQRLGNRLNGFNTSGNMQGGGNASGGRQ
jgi:hypothetical protein